MDPSFDPVPLHAWLIEAGLAGEPAAGLLGGLCERLVAVGVPLSRGFLSIATLHPLRRASSLTWERGRGVQRTEFEYAYMDSPGWRTSPFHHMVESRTRRLHRRLVGDGSRHDFPVLAEFHAAGLTEWLGLVHGFGRDFEPAGATPLGLVFSWATAEPKGWTPAELRAIEEVTGTLALAVQGSVTLDVTRDVLATYLGRDAADRVIAGQVRRGGVDRVTAFILHADLRGFTDFADVTGPEEVIRRLNQFFDRAGDAVRAGGGEILKFLGDGILAVFLPRDGDLPAMATSTLDAALDLLSRVDRSNDAEVAAGRPALGVDVALHEGDVVYGNVGTAERLDFTVIGPAVNEVTRLEALCKPLGRTLLVSDTFVAAAPGLRPRVESLGRHRLRGVRESREVFTVPDAAPVHRREGSRP